MGIERLPMQEGAASFKLTRKKCDVARHSIPSQCILRNARTCWHLDIEACFQLLFHSAPTMSPTEHQYQIIAWVTVVAAVVLFALYAVVRYTLRVRQLKHDSTTEDFITARHTAVSLRHGVWWRALLNLSSIDVGSISGQATSNTLCCSKQQNGGEWGGR
jgi:hypothetical protein